MAENDTIKPIAALPLQEAGTGSIMEPQTEPAQKHWLHRGATNETSMVSWLHGEATNGATNEARNGAKAAILNLYQKTGFRRRLGTSLDAWLVIASLLLIEKLNFRLIFRQIG
ncbi:MAG: hypothetical protein IKH57_21800 [Clostridia bacterium]|nr:hypothetical protein [Clostridia bacterium]